MEQYQSHNKTLNCILEPFVKQLQNSSLNINMEELHDLKNKIKKLLRSVANSPYKVISDQSIIQKFFDSYTNLKVTTNVTPIMYRQFVIQLSELLLKIDEYKVQEIIFTINNCEKQMDNLENSLNTSYLKNWFGEFCKYICVCITKLHKRSQEISLKIIQDFIIAHITQLVSALQLLLKIITQELTNKILIIESRRFVIKRFKFTFDELKEILNQNTPSDNSNSNFIFWMDRSLDLVSLIEADNNLAKNVGNLKPALEEVLCHAMSVAQICLSDESKAIRGSIQSVLHEYTQFEIESTKTKCNPSVINLYVDIISDKLCLLERKINTGVLKISLMVFSDYFEPLQILRNTCESADVSILSRSISDLDDLIADFDLHVDRIMQIGLFAIACSTDRKIVSKLRSCLCNLEALESELVPALTTLYMEPSQIAHLYATLFIEYWRSEVHKLRDAVFFIIDPLAFGQILRDEYKSRLEVLQDIMSNSSNFTKDNVKDITKGIEIFICILKDSLPDLNLQDNKEILKQLKNLQDIYKEVCTACNVLLKDPDLKTNERLFKRFQILLTMIERIIKLLSTESQPDTITKDPSINEEKTDVDVTNIIERGQQLLKDRSMLFRTPKDKNKTFVNKALIKMTPKDLIPPTPKSAKLSTSRKLGVSFAKKVIQLNYDENDAITNNSVDLQITEILEELTCLVDTIA